MQSFVVVMTICVSSALSMLFITRFVFLLFRRYKIVDKPEMYPHEKGRQPLPYPGGVVLVANIILWSPWILQAVPDADFKKALYVIIAGLITTLIMAWDDQKRTLSPVLRLGFQISLGAFFGLTAIKIGYITNIF